MAFIDFTNGEVLTADQMDTVMRQSVMKFADATARDTALSAVLAEGMMCYLDDTNEVLKYDGSSWIDISGDITGVTAGTALTGGGTSGNVTLDVDTAAVGTAIGIDGKQADVITTQGDLVIGDGSGDASRLAIGAADTVLTSNGTTATWVAGASGGGQAFVNLEFNKLSVIDVDFPADSVVRFTIISTSNSNFSLSLFDSSDNELDTITLDTDLPFTYFTNSTAVAKLVITNDVVDETVILTFTEPTAAVEPTTAQSAISIFTTQSVTIGTTHTAYIFGGGGAGSNGKNSSIQGGGGGGSGYFATTTLSAGTYTATIGAGGAGNSTAFADGGDGGNSIINSITANGGSGGSRTSGGAGGSGGGASGTDSQEFGIGGQNGGDGEDTTSNSGGTGSGTSLPTTSLAEKSLLVFGTNATTLRAGGGFYEGGAGGRGDDGGGQRGANAVDVTGGGGGADYDTAPGGNGGDGFILLLEVV